MLWSPEASTIDTDGKRSCGTIFSRIAATVAPSESKFFDLSGKPAMRGFLTFFIIVLLLCGIGAGLYFPAAAYIKEQNKPSYRTQKVELGELTLNVNATGNVEPVLRVTVGAVVSGPIQELFVDFNERVEKIS